MIRHKRQRVEEWRPIKTGELTLVQPRGRWRRWLQNAAWWLCKKLGCQFERMFFNESIKTVEVDFDKLIECIRLSQHEMQMIWDRRAKVILVGHAEMRKLHCEMDDMARFPMPFPLHMNGKMRVFNMDVVLVPWMNGVVLMPDLER